MNADIAKYPKTYIRDKHYNPIGVLVATPKSVGWSLCHKGQDRKRFTKERAVEIAVNRANFDSPKRALKVPSSIIKQYEQMEFRRRRYFQLD